MQRAFPSLWRRPALGLALLALLGSARADDLLSIYAQARAADPVLAQARAQRGVQAELLVQSRAPLLPQWSLSADEERSEGQRSHSSASHLSQVLVDLSQLRSLDAAEARLDAEDARLRAAEQQLCARVAQAYFQVLSAQSALETAEANEAAFAQQVSQAQTRYEAGSRPWSTSSRRGPTTVSRVVRRSRPASSWPMRARPSPRSPASCRARCRP